MWSNVVLIQEVASDEMCSGTTEMVMRCVVCILKLKNPLKNTFQVNKCDVLFSHNLPDAVLVFVTAGEKYDWLLSPFSQDYCP